MASLDQKIAVSEGLPLPSPAEIALAFIFVRSKPVDLTIEDYLKQVRAVITEGPRGQHNNQDQRCDKHLDSTTYWKEAFEKSESEKIQLLDRLYVLEQQFVTQPLKVTKFEPSTDLSILKRKRDETPAITANSRSKRKAVSSKPLSSPTIDRNHQHGPSWDRLKGEELPKSGPVRLLRDFFDTRALVVNPSSDSMKVLIATRKLCRTIMATIETTVVSSLDSHEKETQIAQIISLGDSGIWLAFERSYRTVLAALVALNQKSEELLVIISDLTHLIGRVLVLLERLAMQDEEIASNNDAPRTRNACLNSMNLKATYEQASSNRRMASHGLAKFMVYTMTSLNPEQEAQSALLEALMSSFLDHLASKLSLVAFSSTSFPDETQFQGLLPPRSLKNVPGVESQGLIRSAIAEAPYLIFTLRKLMTFIDENAEYGRLFPSAVGQSRNKDNIAQKINKKLQNTLLRGIFGDQDSAFHDCFQSATALAEADTEDLIDSLEHQEITSEWFIGEVWSYLGWDILAQQIPCS